jgi:hypothetical protein
LGRVGILVSKNLSCKLWDGILDSAFEVVHWFKLAAPILGEVEDPVIGS